MKMENMKNVTFKIDGNTLVITCDLSAAGELSASGKSRVIASTKGNAEVAPGVKLGLNLYRPGK
jgi:hypothetical protein